MSSSVFSYVSNKRIEAVFVVRCWRVPARGTPPAPRAMLGAPPKSIASNYATFTRRTRVSSSGHRLLQGNGSLLSLRGPSGSDASSGTPLCFGLRGSRHLLKENAGRAAFSGRPHPTFPLFSTAIALHLRPPFTMEMNDDDHAIGSQEGNEAKSTQQPNPHSRLAVCVPRACLPFSWFSRADLRLRHFSASNAGREK
jgi:hypothetical protein